MSFVPLHAPSLLQLCAHCAYSQPLACAYCSKAIKPCVLHRAWWPIETDTKGAQLVWHHISISYKTRTGVHWKVASGGCYLNPFYFAQGKTSNKVGHQSLLGCPLENLNRCRGVLGDIDEIRQRFLGWLDVLNCILYDVQWMYRVM